MGKKPVVAIVGLIWAGMALVGCQNCKNCRSKNSTPPTYPAGNGAPVVKQDSTPGPSPVTPNATAGGVAKPDAPKALDTTGIKGFGSESPAVGTPVSTGSPTSSPKMQESLSPGMGARPTGPGQGFDYRSGETPISKSVPADAGSGLPPRPVTPVSATMPIGSSGPLPAISPPSAPPTPISPPSALPTLTQPGTLPPLTPPPIPALPVPGNSGNSMPSIDTVSK